MSSNSSEDLLAYTQQQATRIARADEPWTELMSAVFEAFRGETEETAAAEGDDVVAEDADAVAADVDAGESAAGRAISLPKRLGALALLAVATVLKERAQSWIRGRRDDGGVDPESVQIYDERSAADEAADDAAEETVDAEADEESSGSTGGRLLKTVAVVALVGVAAYALTKKRGGSDEFDDYEYDDDGVDVDDA